MPLLFLTFAYVLWHINNYRLFNAKSFLYINVRFVMNNSIKHQPFVHTQLNDPKVLFQTIQFSISNLFVVSLNVKQFYLTQR